jgi:hypothetical protein
VASTVPSTQLGPAPADVAWKASQWPGFEHVIASYGPSPGLWRRIMPGHASPAGWEPPV